MYDRTNPETGMSDLFYDLEEKTAVNATEVKFDLAYKIEYFGVSEEEKEKY